MTDVVEISSGIEVVETIEGAIEVIEVSGGVTDHGALTGLSDDDHGQYHNDARGDARYALIAQGVTNGDSHDHSGGDGAQIAYSSLSGLPTLGSAAATDSTAYATAAQGSLADSAMQPGDDAADLGSAAATDGYVLTADGVGGSAWEAAAVTYAGAASEIHGATSKTTPVDADELGLVDSAASWVLKKLSWENLKSTLSGVFAVLAGKSGGQTLIGGTGISDKLVLQGTSANGTSTAAAIEMKVGNNGGTSTLTVLNNGNTTLSTSTPATTGNHKNSPMFIFNGNYWDGTASKISSFRLYNTYNSNANNPGTTTTLESMSGAPFVGGNNFRVKNSNLVIQNDPYNNGGNFVFVQGGFSKQIVICGSYDLATGAQSTVNFGIVSAPTTSDVFIATGNSRKLHLGVASGDNPAATDINIVYGGDVGVGTVSPSVRLHVIKTTEQLRLGYDATYYTSFTVNSSGALTQAAIGGQTLIGGTGVTSKIVLQGTSANGTSTAAALEMKVGNNGATTAMTMKNDGNIYIPGIIENTTSGEGIILKSPDGTRYKITVANGGTLSVSAA